MSAQQYRILSTESFLNNMLHPKMSADMAEEHLEEPANDSGDPIRESTGAPRTLPSPAIYQTRQASSKNFDHLYS
jgi:hypothetical protein